MRRSNLSPALMEVLQILKFNIRQERLTFTEDWLPKESDLAAVEVPQAEVDRLVAEGRFGEVIKLLEEVDQSRESEIVQ